MAVNLRVFNLNLKIILSDFGSDSSKSFIASVPWTEQGGRRSGGGVSVW